MTMQRMFGIAAALILSPFTTADAQCPDGSQAPCKPVTVATSRRANPPIDDKTWIVVPFDNLRNAQDVDWLRNASVNLLYLDMSRWKDIRVIDDERVADLIREVPEAQGPKIDLNAGLAVAKRAGAGRLVLGDVLQLGNRTTVTAKVYDVRSEQRVRSVQEATAVQDSVMPLFSKLAQKILNVAPPAGAGVGVLGTTSVSAYQEYLQGVQALNAFRIFDARAAFERALQRDSAFALAHYKMSIVYGWENPNEPRLRTHAEAAARFSTGLPPRERGLINGHVLQARREYGRSCDAFLTLLRADSTDVDAWYGLGDCRYHDNVLEPVPGDTSRMRLRGNLNESIHAFRRALELDPTNHLAYQHIIDAYLSEARIGQRCAGCPVHMAFAVRAGDSLQFTPMAPTDTAELTRQREQYVRTGSRRQNVDAAVTIGELWVGASPEEGRARVSYARALLARGRVTQAKAQLDRVMSVQGQTIASQLSLGRAEVVTKSWNGAATNAQYDSSRIGGGTALSTGTPALNPLVRLTAPLLGRMIEYDSSTNEVMRRSNVPPALADLFRATPRVMLGMLGDSVRLVERAAYDVLLPAAGAAQAARAVVATMLFAPPASRATMPPMDTTIRDPMVEPVIALYLGDTLRARRAARHLDSLSSQLVSALNNDNGLTLLAARAYLLLSDSAAALRMTRRLLDTVATYHPFIVGAFNLPYPFQITSAMILRADLAAAGGQTEEARLWYKRFLEHWAKPAPAYHPLVDRVRKSYAAVGGQQ